VDWPYAGRIDRDSSSVSQNVEESGADDGVVAEAEPENKGYSKKDADKVVKNSGLLTRFFDENLPFKKRVWLNHLYS
jgi:hypothetical protein